MSSSQPDTSSNPFRPPNTDLPGADHGVAADADVDSLLSAAKKSGMVMAAAALLACVGALLLLSTVQTWDAMSLRGSYRFVPYGMLVLGLACAFTGLHLYRHRPWAAVFGLVLSLIVIVGVAIWFFMAASSGILSLIALLTPIVAILSAVFAGIAIGPCQRSARARQQLMEHGVPTDL